MAVTQDSRLRYWPWVLGSLTLGLVLVVVAPPLVLILLVASGVLAYREERRASGNHLPVAIFAGVALATCVVLGLLVLHR